MATATQKSRATRQAQRRAALVAESAALTFLVFEDNGGSYHWTLLGTDGESLARSRPYATHAEAAHAARVVRDRSGTGRLETGRAPDLPTDLVARDLPTDLVARRSAAAARDDSDAERWLDEGGSSSSQPVTQ